MEQSKWNLIVFNAPESTALEIVQRKDDNIHFILIFQLKKDRCRDLRKEQSRTKQNGESNLEICRGQLVEQLIVLGGQNEQDIDVVNG